MKSATRCHFVNPRYDELYDQPCYPSLDALPEIPDTVLVALNPLRAAAVTEEAALAGVPSVIIPGGGVVEGGEAAAQMQRDVREIAIRHGIALLGPNCMGMIDLTTNAATYIGDVNPWLPRGGVAGIAQSGSVTDAFIHSGVANRLLAGHRLRQRGRPRRLRFPRLLPRRPGDALGHPVHGGFQAPGAVPRPGRSRARARQADHGRQGRSQSRRPRRRPSPIPARSRARTGRPMPPSARRASSAATTSTSSSRPRSWWRAAAGSGEAWVAVGRASSRCRRARPRSSPTSRREPGSTCRRSPPKPAPGSCATCRRSATSAIRWTRGAPRTRPRLTPRRSTPSPIPAPTTSSRSSTTSRTDRSPARSRRPTTSPTS